MPLYVAYLQKKDMILSKQYHNIGLKHAEMRCLDNEAKLLAQQRVLQLRPGDHPSR